MLSSSHPLYGVVELIVSALTAYPRIIYRSTLSLLLAPRKSQSFFHEVLEAVDRRHDDRVLPSVEVSEIFDGPREVIVQGPFYEDFEGGTNHLKEIGALAYIISALEPEQVFEIGTFTGQTTRILASHAPPEARVYTLDLPPDETPHVPGAAFQANSSTSKRIRQLYGDSTSFDFGPWKGKCNFVWVDGCHDFSYVRADGLNAIAMAKPGGWIGFHDYHHSAWWSGVTRAVREFQKEGYKIVHIRGTTIALLHVEA